MANKVPYNFGGLAKQFANYKNSKIVILPVPFNKTSTWSSWLKKSKKGPKAIIEASRNMELYDIETNLEVYKKGIFTAEKIVSQNPEEMISKVYKKVKGLLVDKKFVVVIGGEHSVSIGTIKAHSEFFEQMSILHLDAHSDRRDSYEGNKYSHACVMARAGEMVRNIISVGIRSMDFSELGNFDKDKIFYAGQIYKSKTWVEEVKNKLSPNVYVTIDLDVFDPGIMPSVGAPEPGGLDWYQISELLKNISYHKNIIGFDVVELCPSQNKAPDFLAAKLIYQLLSYKFANKN